MPLSLHCPLTEDSRVKAVIREYTTGIIVKTVTEFYFASRLMFNLKYNAWLGHKGATN
jgi:hypothetical protein